MDFVKVTLDYNLLVLPDIFKWMHHMSVGMFIIINVHDIVYKEYSIEDERKIGKIIMMMKHF